MGQNRLVSLSRMSIESDIMRSIDFSEIINDFSRRKTRRVHLQCMYTYIFFHFQYNLGTTIFYLFPLLYLGYTQDEILKKLRTENINRLLIYRTIKGYIYIYAKSVENSPRSGRPTTVRRKPDSPYVKWQGSTLLIVKHCVSRT